MRQVRHLGLGIRAPIRGGKVSNMRTLEQDFAKSISFGKAAPVASPEAIKKKFSI
jgi:hypothetical protein